MIGEIIKFILENFPAVCLIISILLSLLSYAIHKDCARANRVLIKYIMLLAIGLSGIWGFYYHAFEPVMAAEFIGWKNSPFQFEVAVANLGLGLVGIIGFFRTVEFAFSAWVFTASFLWGAAYGHVKQMIETGNMAAGNAGAIFYTDILIPLVLILAIACAWKKNITSLKN